MSLTHTHRRVTSAGCNFRNGPCCWPLYADGWIIHAPTKHATHSSSIGNAQGLPQMYANASFATTTGACLDATHTCQFEGRAVPATTCTCTYVSNHMMPFPLIVAGWLVDGNPQSAIRTIWNYLEKKSAETNYPETMRNQFRTPSSRSCRTRRQNRSFWAPPPPEPPAVLAEPAAEPAVLRAAAARTARSRRNRCQNRTVLGTTAVRTARSGRICRRSRPFLAAPAARSGRTQQRIAYE